MSEFQKCCMCNEGFVFGETFTLTEEERRLLGLVDQRELHYCSSCLKASRNLQQGASILAGFFEKMLRASGIPGAKKAAEQYKQKLITAATRKLQ